MASRCSFHASLRSSFQLSFSNRKYVVPSWDDTETTMAQLIERLDRTLEYLAGFSPEQVDGSEERQVVVKTRMRELRFTGLQYLQGFAIPNLYFHVTTSYNILRHNGVELGKMDFLGGT